MKINIVSRQKLLNGEHRNMTETAIGIVVKYNPVARQVEPQLGNLENAQRIENEALGRIIKNPYTEPLYEADAGRDDTLRGLVRIIEGDLHHPDPAMREAAELLIAIPQLKPAVAARGYDEEEALLNILIEHLRGDYRNQVDALDLRLWVDRLEEQNAEVRRLHALAYTATAEKAGISVKDARKNTDVEYNALINRLNALIELGTAAEYDAFVTEFNVMVKHYETLIRERKTHNRHHQRNLADSNISSITDQTYSGDRLSPNIKVYYGEELLTEGKDYIVEYENNIEVGTATVTIRGKGKYTGKKITTFNIVR